jgi:hypothetical protein
MSTAPDFVPVAIHGAAEPGDQANAAVRGISLSRTMLPLRVEFQIVRLEQWVLKTIPQAVERHGSVKQE